MSKPGILTKARIVEAVVENNGDQRIGKKYRYYHAGKNEHIKQRMEIWRTLTLL